MAETETSYNATGPTVVAFETTSTNIPVDQKVGVSVVGEFCGVYGQGTGGTQKDRYTVPDGTGVCGRGDFQGVYGIGTVDESNTPDFGSEVPNAMGVVGLSGSGAPAVFGDNNILKSDTLTNVQNAVLEGSSLPVGVEGVSWAGHGVFGIGLDLNPNKADAKDLPVDADVEGTAAGGIPDAIDPNHHNVTAPAGVLGLSVSGAGVRGASRLDRGGIFQSATARQEPPPPFPGAPVPGASTQPVVAQIRLVPHRVYQIDPNTRNPVLPRDGQTGDLLAVVSPDANERFQTSTLWFCERGRSGTGLAMWRKVALTDAVIGT